MPFTRRFAGSPYAITKDTSASPKDYAVQISSIIAASALTATTTRLYGPAGNYVDVTATAAEVLAIIDPAPAVPIVTPPVAGDLIGGKIRISPLGVAIAYEVNNSRGRWIVISVNGVEPSWFYTDDTKNPEIAAWPYLKKT